MNIVALLIGLGPVIGWGLFPTIISKVGGRPVNQIIGGSFGTFVFALVLALIRRTPFPMGTPLWWSIVSGIGWTFAQSITFYSFTLVGSSRAVPITTAFQLLGASLWGVFALGDWSSLISKLIGFLALILIIIGAWMTTWSEHKSAESSSKLKKSVIVLLIGEIGYWAYSAAPQAAHIAGMEAFLPQSIGMSIAAIVYGIYVGIKDKSEKSPLLESISYKQMFSGLFFAFGALTYLISAQPNMNGLATGFVLSQTSVVVATLTSIWMLHQTKTHKEMIVTMLGLVVIVGAAALTVMV